MSDVVVDVDDRNGKILFKRLGGRSSFVSRLVLNKNNVQGLFDE